MEKNSDKVKYVDGYVLVIPEDQVEAYKKIATEAGQIWMKHGALGYKECMGDDLNPEWATMTFPKMTQLKPGETVWFSFITYKSREHRDEVNAKVMKDPYMSEEKNKNMPFDMKRMVYGGFTVMVDA